MSRDRALGLTALLATGSTSLVARRSASRDDRWAAIAHCDGRAPS